LSCAAAGKIEIDKRRQQRNIVQNFVVCIGVSKGIFGLRPRLTVRNAQQREFM
jgi:hypothetical protein